MTRVMIAATYVEIREGLCMVLRLAGGRLSTGLAVTQLAADLESAVRLACAEQPDVLLVDLEMAEGYEILRQVKSRCPGTKIIALTAHDYPAAQVCAIQAGADRVLVKGLDAAEMVAAIQAAAEE